MEQIWDTMGKSETKWEEWGLNLSHPAGAFPHHILLRESRLSGQPVELRNRGNYSAW